MALIQQSVWYRYHYTFLSACLESFPLIVFFIVESVAGFFEAVVATTVATVTSLACARFFKRDTPYFAVFGGLTLIAFSAVSLATMNEDWFIVQDSFTDLTFAVVLLVSYATRWLVLKRFFASIFAITDHGWRTLELRWGLLMLGMGLGNEYVRIVHGPDAWVVYRAVSLTVIILFGLYQFTLSSRERLAEANTWGLQLEQASVERR